MLTINGAAAAQVAHETGALRVGAKADLVAIDLEEVREPYLEPEVPLLDALLARAGGRDVRLTMVDGRVLYGDGNLRGLDKQELKAQAATAASRASAPMGPSDLSRTQDLRVRLEAHYKRLTR